MSSQFVFQNLRQKNGFGGENARGKRKERRPIATKRAMHLVLKSSEAVGRNSFLAPAHSLFVKNQVSDQSARWGVRVFEFSNNGNHLHLLIQARDRVGFRGFVRTLSALIARHVTGACKGKAAGKRFWDSLPFTRIVEWGRAFWRAKNYVVQNQLEAAGVVPHHPRTSAVPWNLDRGSP